MVDLPIWATDKQKEGMKKILSVATEYGSFEISFRNGNSGYENESSFYADIEWQNCKAKGVRNHTMEIAWDHEETFDYLGDRLIQWQFVFARGELVGQSILKCSF